MNTAPNTDREYAYLSIGGYGDHKIVSETLGLKPSDAWNIGEKKRKGSGTYPATKWRYDSGLDDTEKLEKHIEVLLVFLETRREALLKLYPDWTVCIQCVGYYPFAGHGFHLSHEDMSTALHLGLSFDFDFYFVASDDEDG
ncbi:MAG: DUF4279 domain-containing protein [Deltaproteobacteria bacterium]|nr:DUF4279 domain-containing protein [Deltaproteobacteria bacterium]